MKKQLHIIYLVAMMLLGAYANADAQRTVVIEGYDVINGDGDLTPFVDAINIALDADEPNRVTDPDVTYILKRDHLYPNASTIKNTFSLRMVADEGTGAIPVILTWDKEGTYDQLLEAKADVYFENIEFDNKTPEGVGKGRSQKLKANGIRGEFRGCLIYGDDGAAFTIDSDIDSCSFFLYDCFVQNCGTEGAYDSNGRFLDIRAGAYADSIVIQNCTGANLNGSFIRAGNAVIGYLKIDHITSLNSRSGNISTQRPMEAVITNNLFKDAEMPGDVPSMVDPAETNPDKFHTAIIDFDTIWPDASITIRNNNVFYSDEVLDMWAKYDTIFKPLPVNPMAMRKLGDDSLSAAFEEVVTFETICDPPIAYFEGFILDQTLTGYPSQHCVGGAGGYYPDEINASYNTDSDSYTAGDDGYPVGDLNWFPELKAKWETGAGVGVGRHMVTKLVEIYPNPAKDQLFISSEDHREMNMIVYDMIGKEIQSVILYGGNAQLDVSHLVRGMYIYNISDSTGKRIQSGKLMIAE